LHDLGEDVREDEHLALALIGEREVSEHLPDEFAVHLAFGVAHLFEADGDAGIAKSELQFLDDAEHGLSARRTRVLDGLDRLAFHAGRHRHESGEETLFIEREVAGRADAADVEGGGWNGDLPARALDRVVDDLGHGHAHQFAEARLVECCDVDGFHLPSFSQMRRPGGLRYVPVTTPPSTLSTTPVMNDA